MISPSTMTILSTMILGVAQRFGSRSIDSLSDIPKDSTFYKEIEYSLQGKSPEDWFSLLNEDARLLYNLHKDFMPLPIFIFIYRKYDHNYLNNLHRITVISGLSIFFFNYYNPIYLNNINPRSIILKSVDLIGAVDLPVVSFPNIKEVVINFDTENSYLTKKEQAKHDSKCVKRVFATVQDLETVEEIRFIHVREESLDAIIDAIPFGLKNIEKFGLLLHIPRLASITISDQSFLKIMKIMKESLHLRRFVLTSMYNGFVVVEGITESEVFKFAKINNINLDSLYNFIKDSNISFKPVSQLRKF